MVDELRMAPEDVLLKAAVDPGADVRREGVRVIAEPIRFMIGFRNRVRAAL